MKESIVDIFNTSMSGSEFLLALDNAIEQEDRSVIAKLSSLAFEVKNKLWQNAARNADNYLIAKKTGNIHVMQLSEKHFLEIAEQILNAR